MKLRNKKTGKIIEYSISLNQWSEDDQEWYLFGNYDSIDELKEEWEDYKPGEPLIEDQKTRKVFREWADSFGAERFMVIHLCDSITPTTLFRSTDLFAGPSIELPGHIGKNSETYTKVEICGDEE